MQGFAQRYRDRVAATNSLLSQGYDPTPETTGIPYGHANTTKLLVRWATGMYLATYNQLPVIKPNLAHWEGYGWQGLRALEHFSVVVRAKPGPLWLQDGKRGDIGKSNSPTARLIFDVLKADGLTVPPYLGLGSLKPFTDLAGIGVFVLDRTSNPEAPEFQDLDVCVPDDSIGKGVTNTYINGNRSLVKLFRYVAWRISQGDQNNNLGAVAGATYPSDIEVIRSILGDERPILVPALGPVQGGKPTDAVPAALGSNRNGLSIFSYSSELANAYRTGGKKGLRKALDEKSAEVNQFR